ncbi:class I SAM-dependent methyltransferase [Sphingorhabdus sp. SMR4y]|uniref:class I SAM-dependent methyltransferase n=1 Tax=Sphingorhabdus sp. SMR4y TaxID=2584094 RepID=UPI000B5C684B|nr:class I SAM-dependent methyltransferase [Sphingorhabdus sp. SMR4y]ASK89675.1 tRNA mo(5)U34 methyltransferase [Sphingorhabdus sp. SMR4y]
MAKETYTPPLGYKFLTPFYDLAIRHLTRESAWRSALAKQINPVPGDRILDVGCGTGSLLAVLAEQCPGADYIGLDPDIEALERASKKIHSPNISLIPGFLSNEALPIGWKPTKITSSLMFHQVSLEKKNEIAEIMRSLLKPGGELHIADYAMQKSLVMRAAFRMTVQQLDGVEDTKHNAEGILEKIFVAPGYITEKTLTFPTATGSISLFKAKFVAL